MSSSDESPDEKADGGEIVIDGKTPLDSSAANSPPLQRSDQPRLFQLTTQTMGRAGRLGDPWRHISTCYLRPLSRENDWQFLLVPKQRKIQHWFMRLSWIYGNRGIQSQVQGGGDYTTHNSSVLTVLTSSRKLVIHQVYMYCLKRWNHCFFCFFFSSRLWRQRAGRWGALKGRKLIISDVEETYTTREDCHLMHRILVSQWKKRNLQGYLL